MYAIRSYYAPVYENEELFYGLSQLKKEGLIAHFGVSVEKMEEALTAMKYDELASIQLIYNMFGKLMSISDDLMWRYFEVLSFRPLSEIEALRDEVGRITSYNVCYTKLLRVLRGAPPGSVRMAHAST